jgi:abhydrolase domain-containing protein 17
MAQAGMGVLGYSEDAHSSQSQRQIGPFHSYYQRFTRMKSPIGNLFTHLIGTWSWLRAGRLLLLIYVAVGAYGWWGSDRSIFQPQPSSYADNLPGLLKLTVEGQPIAAVYLKNPQATYTILYSHGNGEDLGDIFSHLEQLQGLGFNLFAYDYRGYGTSPGKPSVDGTAPEIQAAYDYLTQTAKVPGNRIIAMGRSVGGGPTMYLASHLAENPTAPPLAGLILESTFTSVFRVIVPVPLYPFDKYPNADRLSRLTLPTLVIHGTDDRTIPFSHGQRLYAVVADRRCGPQQSPRSRRRYLRTGAEGFC